MMKRVLIVNPYWPPMALPDYHRVRMALASMGEFGWEPLILKTDPNEHQGTKDPMLEKTVPSSTRLWQAGHLGTWCGINDVAIRSFFHLARLGRKIIREEHPSVVFVSTTAFPLMALARYWRWTEGIPYVLDFQDPWRNDYPSKFSLKSMMSRALARVLEPWTLRKASHVISVSPKYVETFRKRYPDLIETPFTVLPFGAAESDFAFLREQAVEQHQFKKDDGREHWVYVGRGGQDMAFALRAFFLAFKEARQRDPRKWERVQLHFIGTDYAAGDRARKTIEPIARECGVADQVHENPQRIPYLEALRCLMDADALVVPGSDDPGYSASKLYPYILARKPLLAIFHADGPVPDIFRRTKAGVLVGFKGSHENGTVQQTLRQQWFDVWPLPVPSTDWTAFAPYTAREMTRTLCGLFDRIA